MNESLVHVEHEGIFGLDGSFLAASTTFTFAGLKQRPGK